MLPRWANATHPFASTHRAKLGRRAVGVVDGDGPPSWYAAGAGGLVDAWADALQFGAAAELLLVDLAFVTGDFVAALTNCDDRAKCARTHGIPAAVVDYFFRLRWCGETVDLKRPAASTFQGWDCYGRGKPHSNAKKR